MSVEQWWVGGVGRTFVRSPLCQMRTAAPTGFRERSQERSAWEVAAEGKRSEEDVLPQPNESGIKQPVVQAGRCQRFIPAIAGDEQGVRGTREK